MISAVKRIGILKCFFLIRSKAALDSFHIFCGTRLSGRMPRSNSVLRTASLFVLCSPEIAASAPIWCCRALKIVISVAKSLALRMMVGAKSASGSDTHRFIADNSLWKNANLGVRHFITHFLNGDILSGENNSNLTHFRFFTSLNKKCELAGLAGRFQHRDPNFSEEDQGKP